MIGQSMTVEEMLKDPICMKEYSGLLRTLLSDEQLKEAAQLTEKGTAVWTNDQVFGLKLILRSK